MLYLSITTLEHVLLPCIHSQLALRELKAKCLPAEDDITANTALLSRISYCLTTKRAQFKDLVRLRLLYIYISLLDLATD